MENIEAVTPEVATPETTTMETATETTMETTTQAPASAPEQSHEENEKYAAARRRAEKDYEAKLKERDAEYARRFGHLKHPKTGKPIASESDYLDAIDYQAQTERENKLREAHIDPSIITEAINNSPIVREAQVAIEKQRRTETEREFDEGVKQIIQLDPDVKSIADLYETPEFTDFTKFVENGLSLPDAYKLAYFGKLSAKNTAAAKQSAINTAKGKSHLAPTKGTSAALVEVPDDIYREYKRLLPNATREEITAHYNKSL